MDNNPFDGLDSLPADTLSPGPRPSLLDRFRLNVEAGFRYGTTSGAAVDALVPSPEGSPNSRERFDRSYQSFPDWQGPLEGGAALAGQIVGSLPAIENFIPFARGISLIPGSKRAAGALSNRIFAGAVDAATGNALADVVIQNLEISGGHRQDFSMRDLLLDVALGAAIGTGVGAIATIAGKGAGNGAGKGAGKGAGEPGRADAGEPNPFDAIDEPAAAPAMPAAGAEGEAAAISAQAAGGDVAPAVRDAPPAEPVNMPQPRPEATPAPEPVNLPEGAVAPTPAAEPVALGDQLADRAALSAGTEPPSAGAPLRIEAPADLGIDLFAAPLSDVINRVRAFARERFAGTRVVNRSDGAEILIPWQGIKHALSGRLSRPELAAATRLDELIVSSRYAGEMPDKAGRDNIRTVHRYERDIEVDGSTTRISTIVREHTDGRRYYDHFEVRDGGARPGDRSGDPSIQEDGAPPPDRDIAENPPPQKGDGDLYSAPRIAPDGQRGRTAGGSGATETTQLQRVRDTGEALARALDVAAVRQGRISNPRALGVFKSPSGVIRLRSMDDFDTLTHEAGHHVDASVPGVRALMRRFRAELEPLAYEGASKKHLLEEGFAEFFRLWITNRAFAERHAPGFASEFARLLDGHPEIRDAIDAASAAWEDWLQAPSRVAVESTIVSAKKKGWLGQASAALRDNGVADTITDTLQRLYAFAFDDLNPIARAVGELQRLHRQNTGRALDLNVSDDAYKLARMSRAAYGAGHMDIMHGVAPYRQLQPATPALRDAIILAMKRPNGLSKWDDGLASQFGSYLWSRRALGEWDRFEAGEIPNPPDKLTRADHEVNVREMEAAEPQFVEAAAMVHRFATGLWTKKFEAGLIDRETYEGGLAIRDYVPGLRDWSREAPEKIDGQRNGKRPSGAKGGFVRRFRGSKRDVINPLESLAQDAYQTSMAIARNDVVKALDRLALTAGQGGGRIAERIPATEMRATMVDPIAAVDAALKNSGLSTMDAVILRDSLEAAVGHKDVAIFRPAIINEKGEPIAFFRDGGKLMALRLADGAFGRDMYGALMAMSPVEKNFWLELVAAPARVMRAGITTSFDFIGANFIRDQAMASIFYGRPFQRVAASLGGAADDILGRDAARAYSRVYGLTGGQEVASMSKVMAARDISSLKRKGWLAQRMTSWRGVLQITEIAETATRMGLYRTFADEARGRGLSEFETALEASWRARDYLDFDRHGWGMPGVAKIVPFFNVSLQGLDKTTRHMIAPLAKKMLGKPLSPADERAMGAAVKSWARLAALTAASVSLYAWQSGHEDHDEISEYTRATHWTVKVGDKWVVIPKPFEFGAVINLAEAAFEAIGRRDPLAVDRWVSGLRFNLMPPSLIEGNPALRTWFELRTNTNLAWDTPIVPDYMRGMEPFLQYTARTSELSKQIGRAFNVSPAVTDHLITSFLASWGRSALALYDMAQPDAPATGWDDAPILRRFIKDAANGAISSRQFWSMMSRTTGEMTGAYSSWRALMDAGDPAAAADYYARQDLRSRAWIAVSTLDANARRIHPMKRAQDALGVISKLRRDIALDRPLVNAAGDDVSISAPARTSADDILATLAMAIARNSLVAVGMPGWAQRAPIDEGGFYRELDALGEGVGELLADRMATAKVYDAATVAGLWPELEKRVLEDGSAALTADLVGEMKAGGFAAGRGARIRPKPKPSLLPAG